ncbi:GGDEF domain-containing protein [Aeromonas allosaccharophila]|uniref:diguanylate cyclase n=1 Tax=Aeromonas allosaccharophila TaxID=656 RepID=A0A7T2PI15_9GAMM|nr:diguanylate cyclase [Aeromonas allosaccharophila]MCE9953067.1 diguanylate cyclase [Aeromonas allosaccharophila]QPR55976.1 diguanylate cyclase [Aeromonas allosaccharophila]
MTTEREQLIRSLFDEYIEMYSSRDDRLTTRFSDNFSGFAGSSDILVADREEWVRITRCDFAQIPDRIRLDILDVALQDLAADVVAVTAFFHIHLPKSEPILSRQTARLVLIFRHEAMEWKIAHSSISIPYGLARENEIYPMTNLEERQHELELIIELRTKELAEANRKLEALSNTDGLTNIGNRRLFDNSLNQAWERCMHTEMPIALIMLDIDHFKQFNDLYGHVAGDECLRLLAHTLAQSGRRSGELVARYGGEEFVILLPHVEHQSAYEIAQHIQRLIFALAQPHAQNATGLVTVSMGVACLRPSHHRQPSELVKLADAALYTAKSSGRNCIRIAEPRH